MTDNDDIMSAEIRRFISRNIDSVAMLEILLFLHRKKEREWSVDQITNELRSSGPAVETRAQQLVKKGFLKPGASKLSYRYQPESEELARPVEKLAKLYSQYQLRVIDQIYSPAKTAAQELADAFRIKSEDNDG